MKKLLPSPLWIGLLAIVVATVLAACGGHGGGGSQSGAPGSGDQIIFNNGRTGPVSEAARLSDEATVTAVVTANRSVTATKMAQLIVAKMQTLPDFSVGGISTSGDPWGQFKDGSLYQVNVSDPEFFGLTNASSLPKKVTFKPAPSKETPKTTTESSATFPASTKAYIIYGVEPARSTPSPQLATELAQAGYTVTLTHGGVADWTQISNAGVLMNDGHGLTALGKFYVSTTDVETPALDKQYASYLATRAMTIGGITVYDSSGKQSIEQRYCLSIDYLKSLPNYSSMFSANSFFMNVVCWGDSPEAAKFWGPLQTAAGLGDYSGWSKPVEFDDATQTTLYFF